MSLAADLEPSPHPRRRNLLNSRPEDFKPPVFEPNTTARAQLINRLRRFFDLQAGSIWRDLREPLGASHGRLLDIGCGAQIYRPLIPGEVVYQGIDTVEAKPNFGYEAPDTHYFEGADWGVQDESFDTALCTEVLEHIPDPRAFLEHAHRSLRPGGRLLLTVPFAARWHFIPYDYWRYTPSGLKLLLDDAGFERVQVYARGNPLTVACYKAMALPLMLLFGAGGGAAGVGRKLLGVLTLPFVVGVACLANLSLAGEWGDDCLGYTVIAFRPR